MADENLLNDFRLDRAGWVVLVPREDKISCLELLDRLTPFRREERRAGGETRTEPPQVGEGKNTRDRPIQTREESRLNELVVADVGVGRERVGVTGDEPSIEPDQSSKEYAVSP